jgi:hypothetical protein
MKLQVTFLVNNVFRKLSKLHQFLNDFLTFMLFKGAPRIGDAHTVE